MVEGTATILPQVSPVKGGGVPEVFLFVVWEVVVSGRNVITDRIESVSVSTWLTLRHITFVLLLKLCLFLRSYWFSIFFSKESIQ